MEQMVVEKEIPYLPPEIIRNILLRLPVKSLIRFQCVCKDWKNLFKTQSFIAEHLLHSTQQNPFLLGDCVHNILGCNNHCHLHLLTREKQVLKFENPPIIDSLMASGRMVYSNNGLLCVELFNKPQSSFWLWNPAIREIRQVPKSLNNYKAVDFSTGFGFSPTANDYKIVKVFNIDYLVYQVEVYALTKGLWRKVEFQNSKGVALAESGFTFNGAIFWLGSKKGVEQNSQRNQLIVSFDIAMEAFTLIPLPTLIPRSCFNMLTMHENKLAILCPSDIGNSGSSLIDLWVMGECIDAIPYRERWSWTKIYTSRPYPCWLSPMTIWRNEIICRVNAMSKMEMEGEIENDEAKFVSCNLTTDEFNIFSTRNCKYTCWILDYVESLVPVGNILIEDP